MSKHTIILTENQVKAILEKRKKVVKNDKGDVVPEKCDECGADVGLYIQGEPVYLCSKCGKYFGTMPFPSHLHEAVTGKDAKKSAAIYAYCESEDGNDYCILCAKRIGGDEGGKYNPPMGHLHIGESPKDGAVRECEEESGVKIPKSKLRLGSNEDWGTNYYVYLDGTTKDWPIGEGDEENEDFMWVPMNDIFFGDKKDWKWAWNTKEFANRFAPKESELKESKNHKTIMLSEEQLASIQKQLFTESFSPKRQVVSLIRDYLDKSFTKSSVDDINDNGYPIKVPVVSMLSANGQAMKQMQVKDLLTLLDDKFHNLVKNDNDRKALLKQVIIDWFNGDISKEGLLSKNTLTEADNEGFKRKDGVVSYDPNYHYRAKGKKQIDDRIFNDGPHTWGNLNYNTMTLPRSGVTVYNLYTIANADVSRMIKHGEMANGEKVTLDKSVDNFINRSVEYIRALIGNSPVDVITYPQSSADLNYILATRLLWKFPHSEGIRMKPEVLIKNPRGIKVNREVAKANGLSDEEIDALISRVHRWERDEDVRDLRRLCDRLNIEMNHYLSNHHRGNYTNEFRQMRQDYADLQTKIEGMKKGRVGRDATIDKETGKTKNWQIKNIPDSSRKALENIFEVNPYYNEYRNKLVGKNMVIIDDNISSGTTLDDYCMVLKERFQPKSIKVFTLAKMEPTVYGRLARVEDIMGESKEFITEASYGRIIINGEEFGTLQSYMKLLKAAYGLDFTEENLPYLHDTIGTLYKSLTGHNPLPYTLKNGTPTTMYGKKEILYILNSPHAKEVIRQRFAHLDR